MRHNVIKNIGYVRLTTFSDTTTSGLEKSVDKIKDELGKNFQGLILDLRNNPGGLLTQAINITDFFLDDGEIVSTKGRKIPLQPPPITAVKCIGIRLSATDI